MIIFILGRAECQTYEGKPVLVSEKVSGTDLLPQAAKAWVNKQFEGAEILDAESEGQVKKDKNGIIKLIDADQVVRRGSYASEQLIAQLNKEGGYFSEEDESELSDLSNKSAYYSGSQSDGGYASDESGVFLINKEEGDYCSLCASWFNYETALERNLGSKHCEFCR